MVVNMDAQKQLLDFTGYVNPLIGSNSSYGFSHGNIYPAISMPFGMTSWTPQTGEKHNGWIYQYEKKYINGFKASHQPSSWIGDYGDFAVMPILSGLNNRGYDIEARSTAFNHGDETAHPYYYAVTLDNNIKVEFTPTERCSFFRITFPECMNKNIIPSLVVDNWGLGKINNDGKHRIIGSAEHFVAGAPDNFACYFVMEFNKLFEQAESENGIRYLKFPDLHEDKTVEFKIGTSFISEKQADINLAREIGNRNFDKIVDDGKSVWNDILSKIQIKGASDKELKTFYSVYYRTQLFPRIFYEFDEHNKMIHYSPYNGEVKEGVLYTDNGFWDTYRTVYPLFSIISPKLDADIIQGWINAYKESGWFPKWASPGHRECMIGTPMVNIITDALYKNINSFDIEKAYEGCLKDSLDSSGGLGWGRRELDSYNELGYCAMDVVKESTSRTLEYAYNDFCMAQFARYMGNSNDYEKFIERSKCYRNVFDCSDKFMKGKYLDGSWEKDFSPIKCGGGGVEPPWGPYTEGNSWQYTFAVPYDVSGLIELFGGDKAFIDKLDELLDPSNNEFDIGYYDELIHEMTEMVACNMGQYEHNNQPVHQLLYMFNYAGVQWKAVPYIRKVVDDLYNSGPDGFCGDEDNGEMASWYIFSILGFYPVCPGSSAPRYEIGTPRFKEIRVDLPHGKTLTVIAENNLDKNIYVQSLKVNGKIIERSWLKHEEIVNGGIIEFEMGCKQNKEFGKDKENRPPSMV